jgi:peptidoglycan/LPS O-acetylase OafA/YrhL
LKAGEARQAGLGHFPAIDGLRAIAVMAVILFHLRPGWLRGGLAGVDVFFVISGFVVTASLLRRPPESPGALAMGFFARRVVRIVPALIAMLLATAFAALLLIPLVRYSTVISQTAIAAASGTANMYLAVSGHGYFVANADQNPLLHTWTLGVEEQFYLLFPLLFLLVRRDAARSGGVAVPTIAAASALSLLACILLAHRLANAAFYLMPTRFWELGVGVLLCLTMARWKTWGALLPARLATVGAIACGVVLLVSFRRLSGADFPLPGTLPIVASTVGLIGLSLIHPHGVVAQALSCPPARLVGRLSYSLYLWHWPVFALFGWTIGLEGAVPAAAALLLALVLAALSYRLVEQPFRRSARVLRTSPGRIVATGIAALLACAVITKCLFRIAPILTLTHPGQPGLPNVTPAGGCPVTEVESDLAGATMVSWMPHCPARPPHAKLIIVGDSHAKTWASVMGLYPAQTGIPTTLYTHPGCDFPSLTTPMASKRQCRRFYALVLQRLSQDLGRGDVLFLPSLRLERLGRDGPPGPAPVAAETEREYVTLVRRLAATGTRIVFEAPEPLFPSPVFRCLDRFNRDNPVCRGGFTIERARIERMRAPVLARMRNLAATVPGVEIWDPLPLLCPGITCSALREGRPIYYDTDHLNSRGHAVLYPSLRRVLDREASAAPRSGLTVGPSAGLIPARHG